MSKTILRWGVCILFGISLSSLGCEKRDPIKIGFVAGLSGRVADLGVPGRNGAMLAIEQANDAGGIEGRRIELIVRDDRQDNDTAKKVVADLLSMDLEVIIGPMTSSMAMNMVPLVNASSTVMVSPTVTTTDLSAIDDRFLRVISATTIYADKSARYQHETLGHRRGVAIYDLNNQSYTQSWLRDFQRVFESLGGRIVKTHGFRSGGNNAFFEETRKLLESEPDFLLVISNAVDAALICQQVRKMDQRITIVMAEWAATERLIELGGSAVEDGLVAQFMNRNDTSEKYLSFRKAYIDRFKQEPGFAGIAGYDAAFVVLSALSERIPGQSLKKTIIDKARFNCVQQVISIDRFGDADRTTFITTIKDGKYQKIEQ